ncbi:hypothetical protein ACP4OV_003711 [Aristida adscensionis]
MGKRGIVSIFSRLVDAPSPGAGAGGSASPPWPWPSCGSHPQTASFRAAEQGPCRTTAAGAPGSGGAAAAAAAASAKLRGAAGAGEMYKTVNSVFFDPAEELSMDGEEERFGEALDLDDDDGLSTTTASEEWSEAVIRSLGRSSTGRFFVDPSSNSILATAASSPARSPPAEAKPEPAPAPAAPDADPEDSDGEKQEEEEACASTSPLAEGSVAVAVDSDDPYRDFRESMEEMVAAHGLRDWAALEELLAWYLRINGKHNHALIVGAFVDLLLGLTSPAPSSATAATTTTTTTTTSSATSGSASTSSSTATSSTSIVATTTAAAAGGAAAMGQCGRGIEAACSSASSSSEPGDVAEEKASTASDDLVQESGSASA